MTELTELYIDGNNVSTIEPIISMTTLEWLKLGGNPITNIRPAASFTALKKLYMEGIAVSEEDLEYLSEQLPDCKIVR